MSAPKTVHRLTILAELRRRVENAGSQAALAREFGVSRAYLSDVLKGRRDPGPSILAPLGYEKVPAEAQIFQRTPRGTP